MLRNYLTGTIKEIGPFDWVQITYNNVIRVPEDEQLLSFRGGVWLYHKDKDSEWTDILFT